MASEPPPAASIEFPRLDPISHAPRVVFPFLLPNPAQIIAPPSPLAGSPASWWPRRCKHSRPSRFPVTGCPNRPTSSSPLDNRPDSTMASASTPVNTMIDLIWFRWRMEEWIYYAIRFFLQLSWMVGCRRSPSQMQPRSTLGRTSLVP